jgi:hypothetical protein
MYPHVFREVARLGEGLAARVAAMGLLCQTRRMPCRTGLRRFNATLPPIGVPFLVGGAGFEVVSFACRLYGCRAD